MFVFRKLFVVLSVTELLLLTACGGQAASAPVDVQITLQNLESNHR